MTVGLTVLPQGLAYANVAGLPPVVSLWYIYASTGCKVSNVSKRVLQYGLYSSFVGCFIYLFFGGTRAVTVGPSAINCVTTRKYTYGRPPEYAVLLCFVTGVVTLLVSIFQLGNLPAHFMLLLGATLITFGPFFRVHFKLYLNAGQ